MSLFSLQSYRRRYYIVTAMGKHQMSARGGPRLSVAAFRSYRLLEVSRFWRELEMWTQKCHEVNLKKAISAFIYVESLCVNGMNHLCVLNRREQRFCSDWHRQKLIRPFCPTEACAITYSSRINDQRQRACSFFILITIKLQRWERTWGYYSSVNVSECQFRFLSVNWLLLLSWFAYFWLVNMRSCLLLCAQRTPSIQYFNVFTIFTFYSAICGLKLTTDRMVDICPEVTVIMRCACF